MNIEDSNLTGAEAGDQSQDMPDAGSAQQTDPPQGGADNQQGQSIAVPHDGSDVADGQAPRTRALLDSLVAGEVAPATAAKGEPAEPAAQTPAVVPPPQQQAAPTPDQEEAELLEGVKSERGRERIKQVFAERKQLEADIVEFRDMVQSTGMSAPEFAQTLEFGRLASSNDEKNLRVALQMVEQQRSQLLTRLGIEAPGFDALADHPDLSEAVESLEITRERALELAKHRRRDQQAQQQRQVHEQSQQEQQQFHQQLQSVGKTVESFIGSRMNEVDHAPRWKALSAHFQNPENMQRFVSTYQPQQWPEVGS